MDRRLTCFFLLIFLFFSKTIFAWNEGIFVSIPAISKDPEGLHGYNLGVWYNPETLTWRQFNLYFDLLGARYWVNSGPYSNAYIVAASPVVRYNFKPPVNIHPYLELSIGFAYISQTRFANSNMGMHFQFQDRAGVGLLFGAKQQISLGIHAVHYSNASLSSHNSGITIPLLIDLGYQF